MSYAANALLRTSSLFFALVVALEIGHWLGNRSERIDPEGSHSGTGVVEGAVFALLGLLIAFTLSGAATRFDARRDLIVKEANAIGTVSQRFDLLPDATRTLLRERLRRYLDARLAIYQHLDDEVARRAAFAEADRVQEQIWSETVAGCTTGGAPSCAMLLVPALNEMFDLATIRTEAMEMHPPAVIFGLLDGLGIGCALLAGYSLAQGTRRKRLHELTFAAMIALTVYVILDLEYPRRGLIRVDAFDHVLIDLRQHLP